MSPNEAQLRAFLHDGEGDSPDPNVLISHALRVRRDRRRRLTSIASGTAVVAVVVAGVGLLISGARDDESGGTSGGANAAGAAASAPQAASDGSAKHAAVPSAAPMRTAPAVAPGYRVGEAPLRAAKLRCPAAPLHYMLPGGGGIGTYGSGEKLFARPVSAMKVCAYLGVASHGPVATVLSGADARNFATTLESAPDTHGNTAQPSCASSAALVGRQIEVLAVDSAGHPLKPVVITVGMCGTSQATNGTAVRYLDRVPQVARRQLFARPPSVPEPSSPTR